MRSGLQLQKLEAEAERLSDLLSVMEDREEQLLGQVRREEEARRSAEDRVRTSEVALAGRRAAEEVGDKMKKVLKMITLILIRRETAVLKTSLKTGAERAKEACTPR